MAKSKKLGRPTRLTKERKNQIVKYLKAGAPRETVCQLVGIAESTFRKWYKEGEEGKSKLTVDFMLAVDAAQAHAEYMCSKALVDAAQIDWKAAARYLLYRHPQRWSPTREENKHVDVDRIVVEMRGIPDQNDDKETEEVEE